MSTVSNREIMQALLAGEVVDKTPQWLMGFANLALAQRLLPAPLAEGALGEYPQDGAYPFTSIGEQRLLSQVEYNRYVDRCAFAVGWGANAAFGHAGPGEFNKRVMEKTEQAVIYEYETGARKEVRHFPHNTHTFFHPVETMEDLEQMTLPDPTDPARYEGFRSDVAWAKSHGEWTVGWVSGFFSGVHYFVRRYEDFLAELLIEPDFAGAMIQKLGDWILAAAQKMCEAGVDCIGLCDDLGSGSSMLISPTLYREFVWPWHKRLCELAHGYGAKVHLHSHGAILPVLPDLKAAGIDILNPIDPDEQMSIEAVRELVGPDMVLCGGIDKHFFDWTKERQQDFLRDTVARGRASGPFILMDSGGIPENVDKAWFEWFLSVSKQIRSAKA